MERKIGETFEYEGKKLQVKGSACSGCNGCFFEGRCSSLRKEVTGHCQFEYRTDNKEVIFVEVQEQQQDEQPQKLNLCEILKNCPQGETFWSPLLGDVKFYNVNQRDNVIYVTTKALITWKINADGTITIDDITSEEVMLYPSKEQRDWTKVKYEPKKERFDSKTLKPFDRVIARCNDFKWVCDMFSHYDISKSITPYVCVGGFYDVCIPYNDETKHLVGTKDEAPEFYRYWES